ncbi:MAG: hypothetical protein ACTSVI_02635 [Promethearchaeota archaeon]
MDEHIRKKLKKITQNLLPVAPIWLFLFSTWSIGVRLISLYPGSGLLFLGIVITVVFAILTLLYVIRIGTRTRHEEDL